MSHREDQRDRKVETLDPSHVSRVRGGHKVKTKVRAGQIQMMSNIMKSRHQTA